MRFDYTAVGHVTVDVMADGSRRPGGGAFYSALQAARLGLRARILTRGVRREIEALLEPYLDEELSLDVLEAPCTTTLETIGQGRERSQRVLAWAGEIDVEPMLDTEILHLAPVARETDGRTNASAAFVGVTPQGLVREWSGADGRIFARKLDRSLLPRRCDALVLSEAERDSCAALFGGTDDRRACGSRAAPADTAVIAVTHGEAPTELRLPGGVEIHVTVPVVQRMRDDIGAGDVFAAAFFVALADGEDPQAAAQLANAAAAVRVSAQGAGAIGDRASIEARLASVA